ncbi:asparagine synthase-related protein [Sphingomonadaceae bacterium G21617-S1]|nr:asparagine synthase-related protein [Sphingomonadaceae bacterium G21617-S1]
MRLIGGYIRLDGGPAELRHLAAMADAMTAPALSPILRPAVNGPCGLFELDFAATPAFAGAPPGGWLVAADLRLDHPDAFAASYRGTDPASRLVSMIERHGADFPDKLYGDFAVAIWSETARRLWLGRDFAGVRPLAYTYRPRRYLAFASLPKGLHGAGFSSGEPDPAAIALRYFAGYFREGDSGFSDIRYLPPGCTLVMAQDQTEPREIRAWQPDPSMIGGWRHGIDAGAEELRHRIGEAVSVRLPAAGAVCSELSGGLDSSAVTILAARDMRDRGGQVVAVSMMDKAPASIVNDHGDGHLVAAILARQPDLIWVDSDGEAPPAPFDPDVPRAGAATRRAAIHLTAKRFGADIVLTGLGGDQGPSYNGKDIYADMARSCRWIHLFRALSAISVQEGVPLSAMIRRRVIAPLLPPGARSVIDRIRGRGRTFNPRLFHLQPDCRRIADAFVAAEMGIADPIRLRGFTRGKLAARCTRLAVEGASAGIGYAHPLLDRRVVELSLAFPAHHFVGEGMARQPFRRAMCGILPEEVRTWPFKYSPAIGDILRLSAERAAILTELEGLRGNAQVESVFNIPSIIAVVRAIPEGEAALAMARRIAAAGRGRAPPRTHFLIARMAASMARHMAMLGSYAMLKADENRQPRTFEGMADERPISI